MPLPGGGDDFFCIRVGRLPAQGFFAFLGRCDEDRGVAGAARFFGDFEIDAGHGFRGVDDVADAEAVFAAQVEIVAIAALEQIFHSQHMGIGQIHHVDVVADAGAVGGGVVGAVNGDVVADALGRFQDDGDQVRLRVVGFADGAIEGSAGGIEIAQCHIAETVGFREVAHHVFNDQLCTAVHIGGIVGEIFFDGCLFRFAVDGSGGGEDDLIHAGFPHAHEQVQRAAYIVFVIFRRVRHGFADERGSGEVDDAVDFVFF